MRKKGREATEQDRCLPSKHPESFGKLPGTFPAVRFPSAPRVRAHLEFELRRVSEPLADPMGKVERPTSLIEELPDVERGTRVALLHVRELCAREVDGEDRVGRPRHKRSAVVLNALRGEVPEHRGGPVSLGAEVDGRVLRGGL